MDPQPSFIRKPHDLDQTLIVSKCSRCNAPIRAASTHATLKLMEDKHECPVLQKLAARKAKQAKADSDSEPKDGTPKHGRTQRT